MSEGLFKKRFEEILNRVGETIEVPKSFLEVVAEAKHDIGTLQWMNELKDYIRKHAPKLDEKTPIFSARHFISKLDKHIVKIEHWFGAAEQNK